MPAGFSSESAIDHQSEPPASRDAAEFNRKLRAARVEVVGNRQFLTIPDKRAPCENSDPQSIFLLTAVIFLCLSHSIFNVVVHNVVNFDIAQTVVYRANFKINCIRCRLTRGK